MSSETCRICGKDLTVPESVKRGIGPICAARLRKIEKQKLAKDKIGAKYEDPLAKEAWAEKTLANPMTSPAQRTDARVILGMPYEKARRLEDEEVSESLKLWDELEESEEIRFLLANQEDT